MGICRQFLDYCFVLILLNFIRRDISAHTAGEEYSGPFYFPEYGKDAIMVSFKMYKKAQDFVDTRELIHVWGPLPGYPYEIIYGCV